jgi:hypothetical protein
MTQPEPAAPPPPTDRPIEGLTTAPAPPPDGYPDAWKSAHVRQAEAEAYVNPIEGLTPGASPTPPAPADTFPSSWTPKGIDNR